MKFFEALQVAMDGKPVVGGVINNYSLRVDKKSGEIFYGIDKLTVAELIRLAGISHAKWEAPKPVATSLNLIEMVAFLVKCPDCFAATVATDVNSETEALYHCPNGVIIYGRDGLPALLHNDMADKLYNIYRKSDYPSIGLDKKA